MSTCKQKFKNLHIVSVYLLPGADMDFQVTRLVWICELVWEW